MRNLQNICHAGFYDEESIETTFETLQLQLRVLQRSPSFDLEFELEGQYAQHKVNMHNLQNTCHAEFDVT